MEQLKTKVDQLRELVLKLNLSHAEVSLKLRKHGVQLTPRQFTLYLNGHLVDSGVDLLIEKLNLIWIEQLSTVPDLSTATWPDVIASWIEKMTSANVGFGIEDVTKALNEAGVSTLRFGYWLATNKKPKMQTLLKFDNAIDRFIQIRKSTPPTNSIN